MPVKIEKPKKQIDFDVEKCEKIYEELVKVFQENKPTINEIILALSNLTYTLGASIEGYKKKGPSFEDLQKLFYSNPTIGIAIMLQGLTMGTWFEQYQTQLLENIEEKSQKE